MPAASKDASMSCLRTWGRVRVRVRVRDRVRVKVR